MPRPLFRVVRIAAALAAFFALVVVLAACGDDSVPGNAVAKVQDTAIPKTEFNHWLTIAAKSQQAQGAGGAQVSIPDPPNYTNCVAQKRKTLPKPPKGQKAPTDDQLKAQCKQEYEGLRDQVM